MDKSKTHILAFFTGHDAPERKSAYVEMNGQGDELTQLVASVAIKMFSLGTTNKTLFRCASNTCLASSTSGWMKTACRTLS